MRKLDFDNKKSWELSDLKNLIEKLILEKYSIKRIENLLGLTKHQVELLMAYKYSDSPMSSEPRINKITEEEMILGVTNYTYDDLAPAEKAIFDNIK